jgi:L-cystine uptake protein TcyP (sodium:dicarboxylate symporter family)
VLRIGNQFGAISAVLAVVIQTVFIGCGAQNLIEALRELIEALRELIAVLKNWLKRSAN